MSMPFARQVARQVARITLAICTAWLLWALLAPLIAGPVPQPVVPHNCPAPETVHGVGSDLRTYARRIDRCAE